MTALWMLLAALGVGLARAGLSSTGQSEVVASVGRAVADSLRAAAPPDPFASWDPRDWVAEGERRAEREMVGR